MGKALKNQNVKKSNINSRKLDEEDRMDLLTDINDQLIEKLVKFYHFFFHFLII